MIIFQSYTCTEGRDREEGHGKKETDNSQLLPEMSRAKREQTGEGGREGDEQAFNCYGNWAGNSTMHYWSLGGF